MSRRASSAAKFLRSAGSSTRMLSFSAAARTGDMDAVEGARSLGSRGGVVITTVGRTPSAIRRSRISAFRTEPTNEDVPQKAIRMEMELDTNVRMVHQCYE